MHKRFRLMQDDDGHWYVVFADKRNEFEEWLKSDDYANDVVPKYAKRISGSPEDVTFALVTF